MTRLHRLRRERGLSTRQLGTLLGCQAETVRRWDHGLAFPQGRYRANLEAILGAPVAELLAPEMRSGADQGSTPPEKSRRRPAKDAQKVFVTHDEV